MSGQEELREILKRARRVDGIAAPEAREAILRRLIRAALESPETPDIAPDSLRARVQPYLHVIEAAHLRRRRSRFAHLFSKFGERVCRPDAEESASPPASTTVRLHTVLRDLQPSWLTGRRAFLALVPALLVVLLVFLIPGTEAPARALEQSLSAMARIRSLHCTGQYVRYPPAHWDPRRPWPLGPQTVEWWYKAPNRFRYRVSPELEGWPEAGTGILVPGQTPVEEATSGSGVELGGNRRIRITEPFLAPFDFSSAGRIIAERVLKSARCKMTARFVRGEAKAYSRPIDLIVVISELPVKYGVRGPWSIYQLLEVDSNSHLLVRSIRSVSVKQGNHWRVVDRETLDHFEYNLDLADSLFGSEPAGS